MPPPAEAGTPPPARGPGRTLVLVRHGETDWNAEGRAQGHADVPLNRRGHAQAQRVAGVLAGLDPVRLWSSDLARAMQTAEHVAAATGLAVEPDARLREYDVGKRSGLTLEEFAQAFPEAHASWLTHAEGQAVPGEESTAQVQARVVPALRDCLTSLEPGRTGIAVLHGACLMVGLMGLLGWPWEVLETVRGMENGAYCVVSEDPRRGILRLSSYNEKPTCSWHGPDFVPDGPVG